MSTVQKATFRQNRYGLLLDFCATNNSQFENTIVVFSMNVSRMGETNGMNCSQWESV